MAASTMLVKRLDERIIVTPRILVLIGSDRPGGFNQTLGALAVEMLADHATTEVFPDLADLPHLREDHDEPGTHPVVDRFRDAVRASDAVLVVTPEYNGGPPSLIKNAVDHASRPRKDAPIAGTPAAVIGATPTPGATGRARDVMRVALKVAGADPVEETYGLPKAFSHLADGRYDDEVRDGVQPVLDALLARAATTSTGAAETASTSASTSDG